MTMSEYHDYAWELLYHFNCAECKNWWSYTTTESRYDWKEQEMSCPLCGHRARIKPKDIDAGFPIVRNTRPGYPLPPNQSKTWLWIQRSHLPLRKKLDLLQMSSIMSRMSGMTLQELKSSLMVEEDITNKSKER